MTTAIIPAASSAAHWYSKEGEPKHFLPKKDGTGTRPTTLRDARPNGWYPSVTSVLKTLAKPQLERWKQGMACLAVLTAPRKEGEDLDSFIERVLTTEKQQEEVGQVARDRGTEIHAGIESYFSGQAISPELEPWVRPAIDALIAFGELATSESVIIGAGYGGRVDLVQKCDGHFRIWDIKSSGKLPDPKQGAYLEHRLQCAAYAKAWSDKLSKAGSPSEIITGNVYISTASKGEYVIIEHEDWETTFTKGFLPLLNFWCFQNNYWPAEPPERPEQTVYGIAEANNALLESRKRIAELQARLEELQKNNRAAEQPAPVPAPEPVPVAMPNPAVSTGALPTHAKDGRALKWTTATASGPVPPRK